LKVIRKYGLALLLFFLGCLFFYYFLTRDSNTEPPSLVQIDGKVKDYTFSTTQSGSNYHYLWLREHKALFECREYKFFGNKVADLAKQDAPVSIFISENASKHLNDPDASIKIHRLSISGKMLIEKSSEDSDPFATMLLMLAMLLVTVAVVIFIAKAWLVR
jgi:hypothetical protein